MLKKEMLFAAVSLRYEAGIVVGMVGELDPTIFGN